MRGGKNRRREWRESLVFQFYQKENWGSEDVDHSGRVPSLVNVIPSPHLSCLFPKSPLLGIGNSVYSDRPCLTFLSATALAIPSSHVLWHTAEPWVRNDVRSPLFLMYSALSLASRRLGAPSNHNVFYSSTWLKSIRDTGLGVWAPVLHSPDVWHCTNYRISPPGLSGNPSKGCQK